MTLPEKFCIAPFKNMIVGTDGELQPCCEFTGKSTQKVENVIQWWTNDANSIRQDMLDGKNIEGCSHCLSKEQNPAYKSHRHVVNAFYKNQIMQVVDDFVQGKELVPETFELRVSNYCNLKCIMCGEYASSSINQEYQSHKEQYNKIGIHMGNQKTVKWWDDPDTTNSLQSLLENARMISLAGGEPLLVERLFNLLEVVKFKNHWGLTINSSLYTKNSKFLDLLSKFDNVIVNVSVEGIGSHNDYVRSGSEWSVVKENIEKLKQTKVKVVLHHVLQHTSLFALPALLSYGNQIRSKIVLSEVMHNSYPAPGVLTINSAHPADVATFKEWLKSYTGFHKKLLETWIDKYNYDPELNQQYHQYVSMLDSIRGTNFKEIFNPTYD